MLNTHGLKIKGLKKASGETVDYGFNDGRYDEVFYDRSTGEVWTVFQCSLGQNWWTKYPDPSIIKICNATRHMTMQELADKIAEVVSLNNETDRIAEEARKARKFWEEEIEQQYQTGLI